MEFRPLKPEELELWYDNCDLCFPDTPRDYFVRHYEFEPEQDIRNTLVAVDGGVIAAAVRIVPRRMYLCGRAVPMGGIADVGARPEYRHRGLAFRLLDMADDRMKALGMKVSMLFSGADELYLKAGFQSAPLARVAFDLPAAELPDDICLRPYRPGDLDAMRGLYDLYASSFPCAIARDTLAYWQEWAPNMMKTAFVLEADGRVQGYVMIGDMKQKEGAKPAFYASEWMAAPALAKLLPEALRAAAQLAGLPLRAKIPRPLWPDAQGEEDLDVHMMLKLLSPVALEKTLTTTEALIAAACDPVFFSLDAF